MSNFGSPPGYPGVYHLVISFVSMIAQNPMDVMKFKVGYLKLLNKMVQNSNNDDEMYCIESLKKKQPGFYEEIEDV